MNQMKTPCGNFYEDFSLSQIFNHGVPRTITQSDASLYLGLTGSRFALHCATPIAQACGFDSTPIDNFLVFHIAFGKTVNDISLNAVANLGYAEVVFENPCYAGDTLCVSSEVIGLKENSNGKTGVVYVRSKAFNQNNQLVVSWIRWVMINKHTPAIPSTSAVIPAFKKQLKSENLSFPLDTSFSSWENNWSDNQTKFDDINVGDSIFHRDGITINNSDHSIATRLYQNNARVHFDQRLMDTSHHGKRLVYGGHIISLCRTLSYNGLGNVLLLAAINSGTHTNPSFAGDTIYCQTEILDKQAIPNRKDVGLVNLRMLGIKNNTPDNMDFLYRTGNNRTQYHEDLVLDINIWAHMAR